MPDTLPEPLVRLKPAAEHFGVKYRQMLHAVKRKAIPSYLFEGRRYVRLSEIEACLQRQREEGGGNG